MRVDQQIFLITGGAQGIGRFLVEDLVGDAAGVFVLDKDETGLGELNTRYPEVGTGVCELTSFQKVQQAVNGLYQDLPGPTVLVNNAGLIHSEPLVSLLSREDMKHGVNSWHRVIDANLNSVFYLTACVVERWVRARTKGLIVNISSIAANGNAGQSAYSAAKAGVNALTVTWSKELGAFGIRSAAIAPGFIDSSSTRASLKEAHLDEWRNKTPLRRLGSLEEVARALRFIVENDYYNGRVLELDGGLRI